MARSFVLPSAALSVSLLLLLLTCLESARGEESLSCHCFGPFVCNSTTHTCRGFSSQSPPDVACVASKEFHSNGEEYEFAGCQNGTFNYLLNCQPDVQVFYDKEDGVVTKTTVRLCCTSDYCNSREAIEQAVMKENPEMPELEVTPSDPPDTPSDPPISDSTPHSASTPPNDTTTSNLATAPPTKAPAYAIGIIIGLSLTVIIILIVISIVLILHCYPGYFPHSTKGSSFGTPAFPVDSGSYGEPSLNELLEDSGSGSGLPLLIQRSIAGQITLHSLIGKGRFGEVWKGVYKGDEVAVKIFHTKEELSWFHEVEIYQTCLIRHPNILRFIAADNKDVGIQTQLWLITEFCEFGSLYDLLACQTFEESITLRLCYTAASGLDHLHTEIFGTEGKPAIAHRDLKSRNILVKGDYSCCIADLGLALRYERVTDSLKDLPTKTVGTKRYLAPEILEESMATKNFEAFKRADIYSFGLVMWEIARRGECAGHTEEAQLPYFDCVPNDPTLEEMRKLVVTDRRRPSIPIQWNQSEVFSGLAKIIQQCWLHESEARLTALRIKYSLANVRELKKEGAKEQRS